MTARSVDAAILAGGQARRFGGRDKSRLVVLGRPLIVRQIEVLGRIAGRVFVVAAERERFADLGLDVHRDVIPGLGALGGVYTALSCSQAERVLVVACDLPFLDERVLNRLVELADDADGGWVKSARGVEPLLACYRTSAAPRVREAIDAGRLKAGALGDVLRMASLDVAELARFGDVERLLANLNTPEDLARYNDAGR